MKRRTFLQSSIFIYTWDIFLTNTLFAGWSTKTFESENYEQALNLELNNNKPKNGSIELIAPTVAENGVKVPIEVKSEIDNTKSISIFVINNPKPYVAKFFITEHLSTYAGVHIKMRESSEVVALVETDNEFYIEKKRVTVTAGGCA